LTVSAKNNAGEPMNETRSTGKIFLSVRLPSYEYRISSFEDFSLDAADMPTNNSASKHDMIIWKSLLFN